MKSKEMQARGSATGVTGANFRSPGSEAKAYGSKGSVSYKVVSS